MKGRKFEMQTDGLLFTSHRAIAWTFAFAFALLAVAVVFYVGSGFSAVVGLAVGTATGCFILLILASLASGVLVTAADPQRSNPFARGISFWRILMAAAVLTIVGVALSLLSNSSPLPVLLVTGGVGALCIFAIELTVITWNL